MAIDWISAVANVAQNIGNWIFGQRSADEDKERADEAYARARRDAIEDWNKVVDYNQFQETMGRQYRAPAIQSPTAPMVPVYQPQLNFSGIHQESGNEAQNELASIRADILEEKENREFLESIERRTLTEQQLANLKQQYDTIAEQNKKNKLGMPTDKDSFLYRLAFAFAQQFKEKAGTPASMKDLADWLYSLKDKVNSDFKSPFN